jgi:hypothetical protein
LTDLSGIRSMKALRYVARSKVGNRGE